MVALAMENNAFEPIDDGDRIAVWDRPVPRRASDPTPAVWLLATHGGAGVDTLAALLGRGPSGDPGLCVAGDALRRWPMGTSNAESPLVLLVAQETRTGLAALARALRQHFAGQGSRAELFGAVTIGTERKRHKVIEHELRRLEAVDVSMWHVPFVPEYRLHLPGELPAWDPLTADEPRPRRGGDPLTRAPAAVEDLGTEIITSLQRRFAQ